MILIASDDADSTDPANKDFEASKTFKIQREDASCQRILVLDTEEEGKVKRIESNDQVQIIWNPQCLAMNVVLSI